MALCAKRVHLVAVFSVRKCGISYNSMLEHAKSPTALYRVAGIYIFLMSINDRCQDIIKGPFISFDLTYSSLASRCFGRYRFQCDTFTGKALDLEIIVKNIKCVA